MHWPWLASVVVIVFCVLRVCGGGICCGRFSQSLVRICGSRDCSPNTRTSWSCCATNNTHCYIHRLTQTHTLGLIMKPVWFVQVPLSFAKLQLLSSTWKASKLVRAELASRAPTACYHAGSPGRSGCLFFMVFVFGYMCFSDLCISLLHS